MPARYATVGRYRSRMLLDDPLDPRVREYAHLRAATLRLRAEGPDGARDGVFIAEGELVIERALRLGYRMRSLLLLEQRLERFGRLAPEGVPVYAAERRADALDHGLRGAPRRARLVRPQAAARASPSSCATPAASSCSRTSTTTRTSARSCAAPRRSASTRCCSTPTRCDPLYRRSLRISMGEALSLPHARTEPLPAGLAPLRAAGFVARRADARRRAPSTSPSVAAARHDRLALLLGTEGAGLSAAVLAEADVRARIPLAAGVDSLNVAAAAAIAFYALRAASPRTRRWRASSARRAARHAARGSRGS